MKTIVLTLMAACTLLLGGCATTIRSDVTTFHQWPADLQDKSYVLEAPAPQDDTLELRSYQDLVRLQLGKLGFREASASGTAPALKVSMHFLTSEVQIRVVQPVFPHMVASSPYFYPYSFRRGYWGRSWYSPWYDPFWYGPPLYQEHLEQRYQRELKLAIKSAKDDKHLFDVTVHNTSRELSTPAIMPALVQSAFEGFPGVSGQAHRVELKREDKG
jgi:hypothetical protein